MIQYLKIVGQKKPPTAHDYNINSCCSTQEYHICMIIFHMPLCSFVAFDCYNNTNSRGVIDFLLHFLAQEVSLLDFVLPVFLPKPTHPPLVFLCHCLQRRQMFAVIYQFFFFIKIGRGCNRWI